LSIISQLKQENLRLQGELAQSSQEAQVESEARCRWEQEYQRLKTNLDATQEDLEKTRREKRRVARRARALAKTMDASQREVSKALMTLRNMDCGATSAHWNIDSDDNIV
jgi:hypothetical protein